MKLVHPTYALVAFSSCLGALASVASFTIELCPARMLQLIEQTNLPAKEEYPGLGGSFGIDFDVLKSLRNEWINSFDWTKEQDAMNKYHHYTTNIENLKVHFIHEQSSDPNAIPLILNHGWPGSFAELIPLIDSLTAKAKTSNGTPVSFHVVIPSLPGFTFSSAPPANWTLDDTARVFNTLMTEVLGYKTYAAHGTDWGSNVAYSLYDNFNTTVRAAHLLGIPFLPLSPDQFAKYNITLNEDEQFQENLVLAFQATASGYSIEQSTKPNTVGLALYDNPVGQLAWIGEKYIEWSDPRAGTPPSVLTHDHILREVSLYYMTQSFVSSVFTYAQNTASFKASYTKAQTDAPMLFSSFKYNYAFWTKQVTSWVGNLVLYNYHDFGGHFPALDNPPAVIDDIREIGNYWSH
ncbi:Alpha/Beta hydrolase protein [Nemania sp. FL0031]|nr:Alpha/Beta hydrolase protein [Nemania sp. FL0031]